MQRQRDHHLRLPAQRLRIEVIRRAAADGRARGCGHRQYLRRHRRGRAPGAPGDPPRAPRASRGARSSSPAAPPRSRPSATPRCPRSTGCSATSAKLRPESYLAAVRACGRHLDEARRIRSAASPSRARAFLQVQQGCDHRCTFCIIPYGPRPEPLGAGRRSSPSRRAAGRRGLPRDRADRGRSDRLRRRPAGAPSLGQMARRLLAAVPELSACGSPRSTRPRSTPSCGGCLAEEPRLMPHLHLSLQAGDDLILKRMKRRHSRQDAIAVARRARALRPEIALGADLIAGFPTENEEMFRRSLDLVAECGLAFLHVFPYSARPGTPAARMPQVAAAVVRERAARLRAAGAAALAAELAARVGRDRGAGRGPGARARRVLRAGRICGGRGAGLDRADAARRQHRAKPRRSAPSVRFWRRSPAGGRRRLRPRRERAKRRRQPPPQAGEPTPPDSTPSKPSSAKSASARLVRPAARRAGAAARRGSATASTRSSAAAGSTTTRSPSSRSC